MFVSIQPNTHRVEFGARVNSKDAELVHLAITETGGTEASITLNRGDWQQVVAALTEAGALTEPECDCYPGGFTPDSYEGPQEHCQVHGRPAHLVAVRP